MQVSLGDVVHAAEPTHVCSTPALWALLPPTPPPALCPSLEVLALGGAPMPRAMARRWLREPPNRRCFRLLNTYGVTEATVYQTVQEVSLGEVMHAAGDDAGEGGQAGAGGAGGVGGGGAGRAGAAGDGHGGGHVGDVGRALPGVRVRVDGAGGGSEGEVVVGGEQVARC